MSDKLIADAFVIAACVLLTAVSCVAIVALLGFDLTS